MNKKIVPAAILLPFILLTSLFFAWALPNNLTDTMLAAFKRIMSLSDSRTAWIQVVCYFLGYGLFALPGAIFIKRYTYKSGVLLGLGLFSLGCFLFYPAMLSSQVNISVCFIVYLFAIFILFAGLSILETATNSYVCAIGPEETATQRLNLAQSFNPFGSIAGVVISQVFILSQLNTLSASERDALPPAELAAVQYGELNSVTTTYVAVGLVMILLMLAIHFTRMPKLKEDDTRIDLKGSFTRLIKNKNYVWGVVAQFFYVGAQIATWSFIIRYAMQQLHLDKVVSSCGENASQEQIVTALSQVEPLAAGFYKMLDSLHLESMLPRTAEQAGATYYILSLILFVIMRFACTYLMKFFSPRFILSGLAMLAVSCSLITVYAEGSIGVYALIGISGCMSVMFPTIYALGIRGLGEDTKIGGSGMVMAIAGAALLTQIQGIVSDQVGSIAQAYWVPAAAFIIVGFYGFFIAKKSVKS